jgi:hypothetical protein
MDADIVYKNYTSDYSARISGKESVLQEAGDKIMTVGAEPGKFQLWYKIPGLVQNGTPADWQSPSFSIFHIIIDIINSSLSDLVA